MYSSRGHKTAQHTGLCKICIYSLLSFAPPPTFSPATPPSSPLHFSHLPLPSLLTPPPLPPTLLTLHGVESVLRDRVSHLLSPHGCPLPQLMVRRYDHHSLTNKALKIAHLAILRLRIHIGLREGGRVIAGEREGGKGERERERERKREREREGKRAERRQRKNDSGPVLRLVATTLHLVNDVIARVFPCHNEQSIEDVCCLLDEHLPSTVIVTTTSEP